MSPVLKAFVVCYLALGLIISSDASPSKDKTYLFAIHVIGHILELGHYDHDTGEFTGYSVDLIKAVCKQANKNCDFYLVFGIDSNQCWDGRKLYSEGLFHNWFDVCVPHVNGGKEARVNHFFGEYYEAMFTFQLVSNAQNVNVDPAKTRIGFSASAGSWVSCLRDNYGIAPKEIIYYQDFETLQEAVIQGEVELGFLPDIVITTDKLTVVKDGMTCAGGTVGMMTRKEKRNEMLWFDAALKELIKDGTYTKLCEDFVRATDSVGKRKCLTLSDVD